MNLREESTVLSSWKDIARYMGKGVRTVQRWESQLGLPVRRPVGASHKSAVLLDRNDLEAWLATRFSARSVLRSGPPAKDTRVSSARAVLRERMQAARELRAANLLLTHEISESVRLLTERCELLSGQTQQPSWFVPEAEKPETPVDLALTETKRIA